MHKLRCAILDDYQGVAREFAGWDSLAAQVEVASFNHHFETEAALIQAVGDFEIVVLMRERTPFTAAVFSALPRLKLLVTSGMKNSAIDMSATGNVVVCGTGGILAPATELTWALILGLARHLAVEAAALKSGGAWQSTVGTDLRGATLGIVGLGNVGRQVARVGLAFGMDVQAWSPNLTEDRIGSTGVRLAASKAALFESSDVVTVHLKLGARTRGIIAAEEFSRMKPTAHFINTARGPLVDEAALIDALERQVIAGAGIDVFDQEPLPLQHPFRRLQNLLATPHIGYVTNNNYRQYFGEAVEDIQAFLRGAPVRVIDART